MRERAAVIILRDDSILLMYRRRLGKEYYIVPGGTVEAWEFPAEAAIREAREETGYEVSIEKHLSNIEGDLLVHYFLASPVEGDAVLGGEEAEFNSKDDFYRLDWVRSKDLPNLPIVSEDTKQLLLKLLPH